MSADAPRELAAIEVVADRSAEGRCDEGFLRVRRLVLRNAYADGTRSREYPCDVVSRRRSDAAVAVLYAIETVAGRRRVRVLLRRSPRAPIYLRRDAEFAPPDPREYRWIDEVVAGLIEADDADRADPVAHRAAVEALEEAGLEVPVEAFEPLGGETFASPGITDEKLHFVAAAAPLDRAGAPPGDGSVMEECSTLWTATLGEAIAACRDGRIPDMKTEVALVRLADHLGYVHALDAFVDELPAELRERHVRAGVDAARATPESGA